MSFQDVLNEADASLNATTNRIISILLKQVGSSVAVAESVTQGAIARRFASLGTDAHFLSCGIICIHPSSFVHLCDVPASAVKPGDLALLSAEMVKGLFRKTHSQVCISSAGIMGSPESDGFYEAKCTFSFLIQGQLFQKYTLASGEKEAVLDTLSQASFVFLKHFLEVGFNLLPDEETTDG